eukprot:gb/GFBE01067822.1/.p1 GENE.gb/GFBE01067822.1/~~gb/GFBE01067822.1/.p1  ORF type:complete len:182 (+),score=22.66 gb/GFBE01067822.1/:1-546(+)
MEVTRKSPVASFHVQVRNTFIEVVTPTDGLVRSASCPPNIFPELPWRVGNHVKQTPTVQHTFEEDPIYGVHPSSLSWNNSSVLLIRHIPTRCSQQELESFIKSLGIDVCSLSIDMPMGRQAKSCRGFALIYLQDHNKMMQLVASLWQKTLPTKSSSRPLHLQPSFKRIWQVQTPGLVQVGT